MWMEAQELVGTDWSPLLIAVLSGAVGGALVSGVFSVLKSQLEAKRANEGWLREKRLEAYANFQAFLVTSSTETIMGVDFTENWSSLDALMQAKGSVSLLGPPEVAQDAQTAYNDLWELIHLVRSDAEAGKEKERTKETEAKIRALNVTQETFRASALKALNVEQPRRTSAMPSHSRPSGH
jgi:predicted acylesterase/phospholipase RssA